MSFSKETRNAMLNRDGGALGSTSYDFPDLHASHFNHSKQNEDNYDGIDNGEIVNRPTHLMRHAFGADHGGDWKHANFCEYTTDILRQHLTEDEIAYLEYLDFMQGNNDNI